MHEKSESESQQRAAESTRAEHRRHKLPHSAPLPGSGPGLPAVTLTQPPHRRRTPPLFPCNFMAVADSKAQVLVGAGSGMVSLAGLCFVSLFFFLSPPPLLSLLR